AEGTRLLPDRVRHPDAAEVGGECRPAQEGDVPRRQTESPRGGLGELGDAGRVLAEPRRLEPGERRERAEPGVDRLSGQAGLRERLALERAFPDAGVVELRADL